MHARIIIQISRYRRIAYKHNNFFPITTKFINETLRWKIVWDFEAESITRFSKSTNNLTEAVLFVGKVAAIVEMVAVVSFGDASAVGANKIIRSTTPRRAQICRRHISICICVWAVSLVIRIRTGYHPRLRMPPRGGSIRGIYT